MSSGPGPSPGAAGRPGGDGPAGAGVVAPPVRSFAGRWRDLRPVPRLVLGAAAAVVALNAALAGIETVTGGSGPGGPRSSSYATNGSGLAALARLLDDNGHPVTRLRTALDRRALDPGTTVVLADVAGTTRDEAGALERFVRAGGRLVVAGDGAGEIVRAVVGTRLSAAPGGPRSAAPLVAVPEVAGVDRVEADGLASFTATGAALAVLDGPGGILAVVAVVGSGRVVALADPTPWHNRRLGEADNAAFALRAVGEAGRPVAFAEAPHGYGPGTGFAALPGEWRWALGVALAAVLTAMWARGRRLGPAEELERALAPPRRAYVDAMASTLARTGQREQAMAPLQAAARHRLARRAGLPADAGTDDLRRAAAAAGLSADESAALLSPVVRDDQVVAAGRALAKLEGAEP